MRTIVVGDVHLTTRTPPGVTRALSSLVRAHAGARIVFAGDLFDTSAEGTRIPDAMEAHEDVRVALGEHVDRGGELWLVAGNHDVDVVGLGRERVRTTPWFFREGGLHIEHGHFYDPDNAPPHPLAHASPSLGTHFVEEFIAPTGAYAYLNANEGTPLKLFLAAFSWYGARAPYVVYRYFHAAATALMKSGRFFPRADLVAEGQARVESFLAQAGASRDMVHALSGLGAKPTLASTRETIARLYLDRVTATIAMGAGLVTMAAGSPLVGAGVAGLGAIVMAASWARGHDRYQGKVRERLAGIAPRVGEITGAKLVVFGHTHKADESERYANTGSFSFTPGRPFLEIEGDLETPRAIRRFWEKT